MWPWSPLQLLASPELLGQVKWTRAFGGAAAAAVAAGSLLTAWRWRRRRCSTQRFPQVPGLPLLGVAWELRDTDGAVELAERWSREYGGEEGVYEFDLAGERVVVVCRFEEMRPVLALRPFKVTRFGGYSRVGLVHKVQGLFFAEGHRWSVQRRLVAPTFNARALQSYTPALCEVVANLLSKVDGVAAAGGLVDVGGVMRCLNADVISKVAFGKDFGALQASSQELVDVLLLLDGLIMRLLSPLPYWWLPGLARLLGDRADSALDRLRRSFERLLQDPTTVMGATLLAKLAQVEGEKLTHEELVGNLVVLFVAGTDTTSHTLSFALYQLARQPDLQEAVAAEAQNLAPGLPTAEGLEGLLLARAVWMETLRVNSVTPLIDLENQEPFTLAGRVVPAHTAIWLLTREAVRRSPEVRDALGADLEDFRPSRWLSPAGGLVECSPFDLLSFGHGARVCVGKNLANTVGPLVIVELLRRFRIEKWQGPPLRERTSFVQCPAEAFRLRFLPRS